jgi:hypothetical protein
LSCHTDRVRPFQISRLIIFTSTISRLIQHNFVKIIQLKSYNKVSMQFWSEHRYTTKWHIVWHWLRCGTQAWSASLPPIHTPKCQKLSEHLFPLRENSLQRTPLVLEGVWQVIGSTLALNRDVWRACETSPRLRLRNSALPGKT